MRAARLRKVYGIWVLEGWDMQPGDRAWSQTPLFRVRFFPSFEMAREWIGSALASALWLEARTR